MAVTSLWRVKGYIGKVIFYAMNKDKTTEKEIITTGNDDTNAETALSDLIAYTERDNATSAKRFVDGINCDPLKAVQNMMKVKKEFEKLDGTVAYHGYQSFKEGEVTPETAHELGIKLATELWGNKYQVLVTTHLDKDSHIHNHFVLNTVSFVDGKKFHRTKKDYYQMREVSDRLCREYGLSVIEKPIGKGKNYAAYTAEKNGEVTKDSIIRRDIDECILLAISERDFFNKMKARGYTFDFSHKYAVIHHPDFQRGRRLKTLGENYTPESLMRRIDESWKRHEIDLPERDDIKEYLTPLPKFSYRESFVRFVTLVRIVKERPNANREVQKILLDEIKKLDSLIEKQNLLCDNDIDTPEQLTAFKESCQSELSEINEARKILRNKLKIAVRGGDEKEIYEIKEDIRLLSERMGKLRKRIRICGKIEEQKPVIDERIADCRGSINRKEMKRDERIRRRG